MAAKKVQLKDNSGNKAYPVTSSACVGMSDGSGSLDEKLTELEKEFVRTGIKLDKDITTNVDAYEIGSLKIDGSIQEIASYRTYSISNITDNSDILFIQSYYDGNMFKDGQYINIAIFNKENKMVFSSRLHGKQIIALPPNYSAKISQHSNFGISYSKSYTNIIDNINNIEERTSIIEDDFHYLNFSIGDKITEYSVITDKYINTSGEEVDFAGFSYIKLLDLTDIYAVSVNTRTGQEAPIVIWLDELGNIIN